MLHGWRGCPQDSVKLRLKLTHPSALARPELSFDAVRGSQGYHGAHHAYANIWSARAERLCLATVSRAVETFPRLARRIDATRGKVYRSVGPRQGGTEGATGR